jgi:hypothetical protein
MWLIMWLIMHMHTCSALMCYAAAPLQRCLLLLGWQEELACGIVDCCICIEELACNIADRVTGALPGFTGGRT